MIPQERTLPLSTGHSVNDSAPDSYRQGSVIIQGSL